MNNLPLVRFADGVLNARHSQIECMVAGKREQVEARSGESIKGARRGQKCSAFLDRLALLSDGGLEIAENHIALQQRLHGRQGRWRGLANIGANQRLPG